MGDMIDRPALCARFETAIDVLVDALRRCPDELWEASMWHVPRTDPWVWPRVGVEPIPERTDESIQKFSAFWVVAYHCLWFFDFYQSVDPSGFESPPYVRGGPEEMEWPADGAAPLPDRVFSREVLLSYADHGRTRLRERLESIPESDFDATCSSGHPHAGKTLSELLAVNLAHLVEHGEQMRDFINNRTAST